MLAQEQPSVSHAFPQLNLQHQETPLAMLQAQGACDPAKSLWRVPNGALDEPSHGCRVTEQSWQEKPAWSSLCEPQTHLLCTHFHL